MPPSPFPLLPLLLRYTGPAKIAGGGGTSATTKANRDNPTAHSGRLGGQASAATGAWQQAQEKRADEGRPVLASGIPLLLKIDPNFDLDLLRDKFAFEIVSEQEDGYVIVASEDLQLTDFLRMVSDFSASVRGSAAVASVHELNDDPNQLERLRRVLSDTLFVRWPDIADDDLFVVDVGVACVGTLDIDEPPKEPERGPTNSDAFWAKRQADYATKRAAWAQARSEAYMAWDDIKSTREERIRHFVQESYGGRILNVIDNAPAEAVKLPDGFTVRVEVSGKGLRDFVLNYPYVFEVVEPDDIELPQRVESGTSDNPFSATLSAPNSQSPAVCVIDSGIQEEHRLLAPAIDGAESHCFLPGVPTNQVTDTVRPAGHGTRVAGAVLYGQEVPRTGAVQLPFWVQNARVLDGDCRMPVELFPAAAIRAVVEKYHGGPRQTRLFNHSINASVPCRLRHMSSWAAEIDELSGRHDILVIQSAGNLSASVGLPGHSIRDHLAAGREYPDYLDEPACRIANPAQSLQALTVGSVAHRVFEAGGWRSFAPDGDHPSAFSRSGQGIWNVIKPEVVEYGGDNLRTAATPPDVATPQHGRECYPELVRSTLYPPGPAADRDAVGTSFAAPKVAHIAAHLQQLLPNESCLLYRALIVQSARWPSWSVRLLTELESLAGKQSQPAKHRRAVLEAQLAGVLRRIGYGIPDLERATSNSPYRTTLISGGRFSRRAITANECHIYQVPIPDNMRRPGDDYEILIEVTLSYVAQPRRTRRNLRRYMSTWVEWTSNRLGESLASFKARAIKGNEGDEEGDSFGWTLGNNPRHGLIKGARRSSGTVQKDWSVKKSNALPENFCIAVVGHEGWNHDPDAEAKYALTVSFEILGKEIPIFDAIRTEVTNLEAEIEVEATVGEVEELGTT